MVELPLATGEHRHPVQLVLRSEMSAAVKHLERDGQRIGRIEHLLSAWWRANWSMSIMRVRPR
jgi:hypothetical protein